MCVALRIVPNSPVHNNSVIKLCNCDTLISKRCVIVSKTFPATIGMLECYHSHYELNIFIAWYYIHDFIQTLRIVTTLSTPDYRRISFNRDEQEWFYETIWQVFTWCLHIILFIAGKDVYLFTYLFVCLNSKLSFAINNVVSALMLACFASCICIHCLSAGKIFIYSYTIFVCLLFLNPKLSIICFCSWCINVVPRLELKTIVWTDVSCCKVPLTPISYKHQRWC